MDVNVERLRLGIIFSQPALSPQDVSWPRRSPAVGTGLHEPGVLRGEVQSTKQEIILSQDTVDGFLHVSCTSPEQETTFSIQTDIGVEDKITTTATV